MPESDTMAQLRRDYPHLFQDEPAPAVQATPEEPQFKTKLGRGLAMGYQNALNNSWMRKQRDRIVGEAEETGDVEGYLGKMRRLQEQYPEVQRLNRERMLVK